MTALKLSVRLSVRLFVCLSVLALAGKRHLSPENKKKKKGKKAMEQYTKKPYAKNCFLNIVGWLVGWY